MTSNPVIRLLEDQFLHWCQDVEKKQEEQARQMKELQERVEHLQSENDLLQAQVEKGAILTKETRKIAVKQSIRSLEIKKRSPSSLTM